MSSGSLSLQEVYGSIWQSRQATGSLGESTGSKEMSSQVLGGLGESTAV